MDSKQMEEDEDYSDKSARLSENIANVIAFSGLACSSCGGAGEIKCPTEAICDVCWGTGRSDITGVNLAEQRNRDEELKAETSLRWFWTTTGLSLGSLRRGFFEVTNRLKSLRWDSPETKEAARVLVRTLEKMINERARLGYSELHEKIDLKQLQDESDFLRWISVKVELSSNSEYAVERDRLIRQFIVEARKLPPKGWDYWSNGNTITEKEVKKLLTLNENV